MIAFVFCLLASSSTLAELELYTKDNYKVQKRSNKSTTERDATTKLLWAMYGIWKTCYFGHKHCNKKNTLPLF